MGLQQLLRRLWRPSRGRLLLLLVTFWLRCTVGRLSDRVGVGTASTAVRKEEDAGSVLVGYICPKTVLLRGSAYAFFFGHSGRRPSLPKNIPLQPADGTHCGSAKKKATACDGPNPALDLPIAVSRLLSTGGIASSPPTKCYKVQVADFRSLWKTALRLCLADTIRR